MMRTLRRLKAKRRRRNCLICSGLRRSGGTNMRRAWGEGRMGYVGAKRCGERLWEFAEQHPAAAKNSGGFDGGGEKIVAVNVGRAGGVDDGRLGGGQIGFDIGRDGLGVRAVKHGKAG